MCLNLEPKADATATGATYDAAIAVYYKLLGTYLGRCFRSKTLYGQSIDLKNVVKNSIFFE